MIPGTRLLVCFLSMFAVVTPAMSAESAGSISTTVPAGTYQLAWLKLEKGGLSFEGKKLTPIDTPLILGLRDGKVTVAWFTHPAMVGARLVWLDRATLALEKKAFKGILTGRTNIHWGSKVVHDYTYTVDATVAGNKISGTFTAEFLGEDGSKATLKGKVSGTVQDDAKKTNALAAGKNWPHYYGAGFALAGPSCATKMIDDLAQARPVWKSEAFIPTAYGSAPDSRYFDRAGRTDSGGGSSSPVIVDGRVYQFFYYPAGPVGRDKVYGKYETEADLLAIARKLFPKREIQQKAVVNHFRTQADEFVVCLDATTGQTLWKATMPKRGNNYQTHKHRGLFPVALVTGGTVYQAGTTGRLYALDAVTGKLKWEYPEANPKPYSSTKGGIDCHAPSPVLVGGVVAFAAGKGVTGVEVMTGKKKWHLPLAMRGSLLVWKGPTRTLLLATDHNHQKKESAVVAIDPASGKVVWRKPVEFLTGYTFPLLAGDLLIGYSTKREKIKPGQNDGLAVIHAYKVSEKGLTTAWTTPPLGPIVDTVGLAIHGAHVYVSAGYETFCLSLAKGEKVASVKNIGGARTQTAFVADGRLFIQPEGRHGKQSFFMLDADPRNFKALGKAGKSVKGSKGPADAVATWLPPHPWTTAYANQPIVYPLVDGRLFVRGLDALYCYDLRKPAR